MKLNISYRPFSGTIMVWDALNDVLPEDRLSEIVITHMDGNEDTYFVAIGTLDGEFHELQVLDCHGAGQGWNLWASGYLPDETINKVMELVANWQAKYSDSDDLRVKMLAYHKAEMEVGV